EPLTAQACDLLMNLIFEPNVTDGSFNEDDMAREKRKAIEHLQGEYADKRLYAKRRLIEEMYADSGFGTPKCGTEEQIEALTGKDLYEAWQEMLQSAFIRVNVISAALPPKLFQNISECFKQVDRKHFTDRFAHSHTRQVGMVHNVTEHMDVTQGKVAMGFSSELAGDDSTTASLFVMTDIFGGGPYSRLFANVREKLSLCYYCVAVAQRIKGLMTVDIGVESKNAERAKQEILKQLEIVQNGKFDDFEFNSSIKSTVDSLHSISDSQASMDAWYTNKISNATLISPDDFANMILSVTKEDVIKAAQGIHLHTVYQLLPKEN
ncbi:MAG: insulinase family protein, partial [Clostridia bacterium]|nr:insulinase family protein [Clostridia bacterium]